MTDYFAVFGLPRKLAVDGEALQRRFYELSRQHHPDFHQGAGAERAGGGAGHVRAGQPRLPGAAGSARAGGVPDRAGGGPGGPRGAPTSRGAPGAARGDDGGPGGARGGARRPGLDPRTPAPGSVRSGRRLEARLRGGEATPSSAARCRSGTGWWTRVATAAAARVVQAAARHPGLSAHRHRRPE